MKLNFFKMEAQGNDYIYFDFIKNNYNLNFNKLAKYLSDRNKGIGGDGIIILSPSKTADAKMRIFNLDGSEAKMCGSALRCSSYYLIKKLQKNVISIETLAGIKTGKLLENSTVEVSMGTPKYIFDNKKITVHGKQGTAINIGNPHFVIEEKFDTNELYKKFYETAPKIEKSTIFEDGVNVHQAFKDNTKDKCNIKMIIWEIGSGLTKACGTGACAVSFYFLNKYKNINDCSVDMPGGKVFVTYNREKKEMFLKGKVNVVFKGEIEIDKNSFI